MLEMGTPKIVSLITNLHIKRPRITVNLRIGSRKTAISHSQIIRAACTLEFSKMQVRNDAEQIVLPSQ